MPWVRIADGALRNLKIARLSDNAFRLWVAMLSHCQEHLTDGLIRHEHIKALPIRVVKVSSLSELCAPTDDRAPLLHKTGEGYRVHDYDVWNELREDVLAKREQKRARMAKWRASASARQKAPVETRLAAIAETRLTYVDETRLTPMDETTHHTTYRSDQSISIDQAANKHLAKGNSVQPPPAFEEFWTLYPRHEAKRDAVKAWNQVKPTGDEIAAILQNVALRRESFDWTKESRKYVPLPASYLRGRRWEDEHVQQHDPPALTVRELDEAKALLRRIGGCPHEPKHDDWRACVEALARRNGGN